VALIFLGFAAGAAVGVALLGARLDQVRMRAEVASIVDDLVGRPVAALDPALAFHLLDGRTLTIEGAPVCLSVRAVVIGPETEFWVELRVAPEEGTESGG